MVELEEQLRLKEALARLGELTAGIAHEFRNGLATIHGYSRLLVPDALPAAYRPYVEGIRNETEALGQVVTNFLKFARPETVSFTPVALGPLVRRASDDLLHELPAGTVIETSGEFGEIQGDEVLLKQVFGNLLRNAAEACESGRRSAGDRDRGGCRPKAGYLRRVSRRQRTGHSGVRAAIGSSSRSSPRDPGAPGWDWPSCRRSWSPTMGGSLSACLLAVVRGST